MSQMLTLAHVVRELAGIVAEMDIDRSNRAFDTINQTAVDTVGDPRCEPVSPVPEAKPKRKRTTKTKTVKTKRQLSPEARARIVAAQKKRWKEFRAVKASKKVTRARRAKRQSTGPVELA